MKRKIVKHGNSTLTISLPSKWVKINKLEGGQYLNLDFSKEGLIVSPEKTLAEKIETTISGDREWYVHRILNYLYTTGYDEIVLNYSTKEQLTTIRKALESLTGFEIIESTPQICRIKCLTSLADIEYSDTLRRIMWLILSQFDYFMEDCKLGVPRMYDEVNEIYKTIAKLTNLCRRLINKRPLYDSVTSKYAFRFLTGLLDISSFLLYVYQYSQKTKRLKLTSKELDFAKQVREFYYTLLTAFPNLNLEKTKLFFNERELIFSDIKPDIHELLYDKNPVVTHYFLEILKDLSSIGNFILVLKLNEEKK